MINRHYVLFITVFLLVAVLVPLRMASAQAASPSEELGRSSNKLTTEEIHDLFSEAKTYFRQAGEQTANRNDTRARELYRLAVARFYRIVHEGGVENGKLFYNIGNIYFLMGDVGRAILNFRRAERYIPLDTNLKENLQTARLQRADTFDLAVKKKILKTVFFWHYDLALKTRFVLFAVLMNIVWILGIVGLFFRRAYGLKPVFVIMTVLTVLLLISVAGEVYFHSRWKEGVVLADSVTARKGDGENYNPSFETPLHAGTEFKLLERRGNWWRIELPDGRRCWLPDRSGELI